MTIFEKDPAETTEKLKNHHHHHRMLLAQDFRRALETRVPRFLAKVADSLRSEYHIDVSALDADHVCWRTESLSEYTRLVDALLADPSRHFQLLIESEIGGRPIATFQVATPIRSIETPHHQVEVVEIPSPKGGSPYSEGLEHVEFVIGDGSRCTSPWNDENHQRILEGFRTKHPHVAWNTKAVHKTINPDLSVKMKIPDFGICSAKFHLMPLADVIAAEKAAGSTEKGTGVVGGK